MTGLGPGTAHALSDSCHSVLQIAWPGRADLSQSGLDRPVFGVIDSVLPECLESVRREVGVSDRVRDVFVPEIVLQGSRVVALIGDFVSTGVA